MKNKEDVYNFEKTKGCKKYMKNGKVVNKIREKLKGT